MNRQKTLFVEGDLRAHLDRQRNRMFAAIDKHDGNRLLNTSPTDLAAYFAKQFHIDPAVILDDSISVSHEEATVDARDFRDRFVSAYHNPVPIPATTVTLDVPFTGNPSILICRGSRFTTAPPRAEIRDGCLRISVTHPDHDPQSLQSHLQRELDSIRKHLTWNDELVSSFNESLESEALQRIGRRRDRLLANQNLVANLGFPIRQRQDSKTYTPPEVRRRVRTAAPPSSATPFVPEPALAMEEYEHILKLMLSTARMLERSPSAFSAMGEEQLRNQFLVVLNSHYEGQTTGETFNAGGKTDILVRSRDRSVFIAECKIWRGAKSLLGAVDQLLSYTTWRDTKTAVVVFNRNKNISDVIAKIPTTLARHPRHKRERNVDLEGAYRCLLSQRDDPNREMVLTVLVVDVPDR